MARTDKELNNNSRAGVSMVEQTLNSDRTNADRKAIGAKLTELLAEHGLKSNGCLADRLKLLLSFYSSHPESLPTWRELSLYPVESESYRMRQQVAYQEETPTLIYRVIRRPVTFELNDDDELIEI
jgi:hypothetical protein